MGDRLFVAVIGSRRSGKSTTWNTLFGHAVQTGPLPRLLEVSRSETVEVFLISGSNEERKKYASKVLRNVNCRIVLCSVQYKDEAQQRTWDYVFENEFAIYAQWLNPGHDGAEHWDRLGIRDRLLDSRAVLSIRDGRAGSRRLKHRVEEIRQFIHGWAAARNLVIPA